MWDRFVNNLIDRHISPSSPVRSSCYRILDAGCGLGIIGITTRLRHHKKNLYIEGCDIYEPFIEIAKRHNIYDEIRNEDITKMIFHRDKEFDLAIGIGVLAHLSKDDGKFFKTQLERIAHHVILTAPTVHLDNHTSCQNDPNVCELSHKSKWSYKDFKGYNIRGFHRKGSTGGSIIDTWLYPPLYSLTAINPIFTKLTQYLVAWK